jgi:hypothetical protein
MNIRRAKIEDAHEACAIIRRSITDLCYADQNRNELVLGKWLSNKTVENVTRWIAQSYVVVAEEAGAMLGVAAMTSSGKITLNYVAPHARFRGVSSAHAVVGSEGEGSRPQRVHFGDDTDRASLLPESRVRQE